MVEAISGKNIAGVKANLAVDSSAGKVASNQPGTSKSEQVSNQPLNPRLRYDRLAGVVVTEFLNQSGTVQLQTPSNAVLAYLKAGLGVDGRSKYQPEEEPAKQPDTTFDS